MLDRNALTYLTNWSKDDRRKPLLLRGARQVGKTSLVRELGRKQFAYYFELNLEDRNLSRNFRTPMSLDHFIEVLRLNLNIDVKKPNSLLFIDEIQEIPWILELFRFFYENHPEIAVIGSGSLLEVKLKQLKISIPVGRIENKYLFPLSFYEFLKAVKENELIEYLNNVSSSSIIPEPIHQKAISLYHKYSILGGMPEVVNEYVKSKSNTNIAKIKNDLLITYLDDASKYASSTQEIFIQHVLENAPNFAGCRFSYAKFANSNYGSSNIKNAFEVLSKAMLIHLVDPTDKAEIPLISQSKRQKKLVYLDVGLVSKKFGLGLDSPEFTELCEIYRGQIAEQIVGQQLIADLSDNFQDKFFYWSKLSTAGEAEVDYLIQYKSRIIAIEVKSGVSGKLKSLKSLIDSYPNVVPTRIYSGPLRVDSFHSSKLVSIPFYLVDRLFELVG